MGRLGCIALLGLASCVGDAATVAAPSCTTGQQSCAGQCVDVQLDPANCGECGTVCPLNQLCSTGRCADECLGGTTQCGSLCADLKLDPFNCGMCDRTCQNGEVCSNGMCGTSCTGVTIQCGSACVDPSTDASNCGDCGVTCEMYQVCLASACVNDPLDYGTVAAVPGASCKDILTVNRMAADGVYFIEPAAKDPATAFQVYCDMAGGGWTLLYNSVGDPNGATTAFWQISYAERLSRFGGTMPSQNLYVGLLYEYGTEYRDDIVDLNGMSFQALLATATGINPTNMAMANPAFMGGSQSVYNCHFSAGWASFDADYDSYAPSNCAANYSNVTQHYCACWNVNLGSDADSPYLDSGWGPHVSGTIATELGMASDGSPYTRVNRVSRWARW